eukprot:5561286-Pyramimonas_sp.AAC.1
MSFMAGGGQLTNCVVPNAVCATGQLPEQGEQAAMFKRVLRQVATFQREEGVWQLRPEYA